MSLENKIKKLLTERAVLPTGTGNPGDQAEVNAGSSQDPQYGQLDQFNSGASAAAPVKQATLPISNQSNGDKAPLNAGSSQDAPSQPLDANNSGSSAAAPVGQTTLPISNTGSGDVEALNKGQYALSSVLPTPGQGVSEATKAALKADVSALFEGQEGLAEGFVEKAAGLFEAAVVARTTVEVEKAREALTEAAEAELSAAKAKLTEDIDAFLSYVVESWVKDNKLAVEAGLRTEIAESFISGLKDLFVENYIEVPEDKVNVVEGLSADLDKTKSRLNEEIEKSIALSDKIVELEKAAVLESAAKGLAATDAERLVKLTEGVEFDSKEMFAEKVAVIKEAHFKTAPKKSAETLLAEQAGSGNTTQEVSPSVARYVSALNRGTRF